MRAFHALSACLVLFSTFAKAEFPPPSLPPTMPEPSPPPMVSPPPVGGPASPTPTGNLCGAPPEAPEYGKYDPGAGAEMVWVQIGNDGYYLLSGLQQDPPTQLDGRPATQMTNFDIHFPYTCSEFTHDWVDEKLTGTYTVTQSVGTSHRMEKVFKVGGLFDAEISSVESWLAYQTYETDPDGKIREGTVNGEIRKTAQTLPCPHEAEEGQKNETFLIAGDTTVHGTFKLVLTGDTRSELTHNSETGAYQQAQRSKHTIQKRACTNGRYDLVKVDEATGELVTSYFDVNHTRKQSIKHFLKASRTDGYDFTVFPTTSNQTDEKSTETATFANTAQNELLSNTYVYTRYGFVGAEQSPSSSRKYDRSSTFCDGALSAFSVEVDEGTLSEALELERLASGEWNDNSQAAIDILGVAQATETSLKMAATGILTGFDFTLGIYVPPFDYVNFPTLTPPLPGMP